MSRILHAARICAGISQAILARKAGLSRNTIVNMEKGNRIREDNFISICKVLGVEPESVDDACIYNAVRDNPRWRLIS